MNLSEHPQYKILQATADNVVRFAEVMQTAHYFFAGGYFKGSGVSPFWADTGLTIDADAWGGDAPNWEITLRFTIDPAATDAYGITGTNLIFKHRHINDIATTHDEWRVYYGDY